MLSESINVARSMPSADISRTADWPSYPQQTMLPDRLTVRLLPNFAASGAAIPESQVAGALEGESIVVGLRARKSAKPRTSGLASPDGTRQMSNPNEAAGGPTAETEF